MIHGTIFRTVHLCYNKESAHHFQKEFVDDLDFNGIQFERIQNVVIFGRKNIEERHIFITPDETNQVVGKRYNDLILCGKVREHPKFNEALDFIKKFEINNLFNVKKN